MRSKLALTQSEHATPNQPIDLSLATSLYIPLSLSPTLCLSRLGGRFTIRPQHSQQQLQLHSSFSSNNYNSSSNNKSLTMGDSSNRNLNNANNVGATGARARYAPGAATIAGEEPAERAMLQQRSANSRSISFRNVGNGRSAGSGNVTNIGRNSFRLAGGGILRQSSTPASSSSTSTSFSTQRGKTQHPQQQQQQSSFWRKHGGNPNLMDR